MARRRILYVGTLPPHPGGSAMWSGGLLPRLAALGHPITAVAPLPDGATADDTRLTRSGIAVERYPVPYFDTDPFANTDRGFYEVQKRRVIERIGPIVAAGWPDVILIGNETFIPGIPGVARPRRIPTVGMVHTIYWANDARLRHVNFGPGGTLENLGACDRVVCVARHAAAVLERLGLGTLTTIPNAVDIERYRPRGRPSALAEALGIPPDAPVVSHVANLKPIKQSWRLIKAAPMILARHPGAVFLLMGDGPCRDELARLRDELGQDGRVRLLGWVDHERIPEYYALTDVVALTSASEGAPFVFPEALASGCGVVSTPIDAAREFLHGVPGTLIAESHEPADIADAVCRLLDEVAGRRLRDEIAKVAATRFDLADTAQRFSVLIDSVRNRV